MGETQTPYSFSLRVWPGVKVGVIIIIRGLLCYLSFYLFDKLAAEWNKKGYGVSLYI